ncbi:MAG: class II aldolase/adducin family protein [Chloroflexi bacterium]|nr:class II aldolase/adducin family protein [Chloroflexota bacterium]
MDNPAEIKEKLAKACRILYHQGWRETYEGHISYRVPGTDTVYIPAHRHSAETMAHLGNMDADGITVVYLDGRETGLEEPVSEYVIHTEIYKARPDVLSVCHCHPFFATTFSCTKQELLAISRHTALFPGGVPHFDAGPQLVHLVEQGQGLVKALGQRMAAFIRGHGIVTVGKGVEDCLFRVDWLELACRTQFVASQMGELNPWTWPEMAAGHFVNEVQGPAYWRYYLQLGQEKGWW